MTSSSLASRFEARFDSPLFFCACFSISYCRSRSSSLKKPLMRLSTACFARAMFSLQRRCMFLAEIFV